jgi:hypothetical protein
MKKGTEEYLLVVVLRESCTDEQRAQAIAIAKSVRVG